MHKLIAVVSETQSVFLRVSLLTKICNNNNKVCESCIFTNSLPYYISESTNQTKWLNFIDRPLFFRASLTFGRDLFTLYACSKCDIKNVKYCSVWKHECSILLLNISHKLAHELYIYIQSFSFIVNDPTQQKPFTITGYSL
jgi:hypothetical protein